MARDRFLAILSFLHFSNNDDYIPRGQAGHQPMHKLQFIYGYLRDKFSSLYTPRKEVCIDEAICPWRGRLAFRVYMKDKPCKWGIKLYEICESTSGYICDFEIYCGDPLLSNSPTDVCLRLMEPYFGRGCVLFTDNYYTCPTLSEKLLEKGTMSVGTVKSNRVGMPKSLAGKVLPRGETDYLRKGKMCAVKWADLKNVTILTTIHDPTQQQSVTTRTATKDKPVAVQDYVMKMSGVDRSDQMAAFHPLHRRTMKWPKKLFMHLLTLCFIQARIVYNKKASLSRQKQLSLYDFLVSLGIEMTEDFQSRRADILNRSHMVTQTAPAPSPKPPAHLQSAHGHTAEEIPPTAKREKPYQVCKVCSEREWKNRNGQQKTNYVRKETRYWCSICKVALCVVPCVKEFDSKRDYV